MTVFAYLETFHLLTRQGAMTAAWIAAGYLIARTVILPAAGNLASRAAHERYWAPVKLEFGGINHIWACSGWPMLLGGWLGIAYYTDRADFLWYIQDALTWWPDYLGSATCWAVNAAIATLALGLAGFGAAVIRAYGWSGGVVMLALTLPTAAAAFCGGILLGPAFLGFWAIVMLRPLAPITSTANTIIVLTKQIAG
jgi:hypothetical protein